MKEKTNNSKFHESVFKKAANFSGSFEDAGIGFWDFDITSKVLMFDDYLARLLGKQDIEKLEYSDFLSSIHPEDRAKVDLAFESTLKKHTTSKLDISFRTKSANAMQANLIRFAGTVFYKAAVAESFTGFAMKVNEQPVSDSEAQKLTVLVNNSPDFMGISDNDGNLRFLNKAGKLLVGLNDDADLSTLKAADFYAEDQIGRMKDIYEEVKKKGSWHGKIVFKHFKTGEAVPGNVAFEPVIDAQSGEVLGRSATVRDLRPELIAQKALLDSEAMFRHVTQNAPACLWMSDAEGKLIYLNKTLIDWTGIPYNDLLGFGWANAIIEEDRQRASRAFMNAILTRTHYDVEFRINKSDGTSFWCRSAGDPYFDDNQNYAGYAGFCIDIHQHVEMSDKLRESEERTRSIVEQAPVAIGVLRGRNFVVESCNEKLLNIWGKSRLAIGLPIIKAIPEIQGQGFIELLEGVFDTGVPFNGYGVLVKLIHKGASEDVYVDFVYTPIKDAAGTINGVLVLATDVTTQILATKSVTESEVRFRSLIEEAPVATALYMGRELKIDVANDSMISYWGKSKEVIGMPLAKALPELEGQPFLQILDDVFTSGKTAEFKEAKVDLEYNGVLKTCYFDFTYKAMRNTSGNIYGILNMAVDVTERVLAKWQLEKSQQQLLTYFEQSPVAIAIIAKENLTFKMANPFYGELVGRRPEDIENKSLLDALPELKGQGFDNLLQQVIDTGIPVTLDEVPVDILRKGQMERIYVNLTYQPQRTINNDVTGILVVATDVTTQVISRQKIEDSEAKIKSILSTAPLAISLFIGNDFIVEMPNQTFLNMVGKDESIIGKPLREAVPEFERESQPFIQFLKNVYNTGKALRKYGFVTKIDRNGELTESFYDIAYTPIFDNAGKVYAIAGISADVTEQLNGRKKLEEADNFLRGAIDLANLGTWTLDIKTRILDYDSRLRSWFGFDEDELINSERAYHPIAERDHAAIKESMLNAITPGTDGKYDVEYTVINSKTGNELIIHAQGMALYDERDEPYKVSGTARDVTKERHIELELKKLVQQQTEQLQAANEELQATNEEMAKTNEEMEEANQNLFRSNEELSQYAYVASHDLQEPLRKIRVFSGILGKQKSLTEENKSLVNKIESSSARMTLLIKDLLEFSRLIKSDQMKRPVNLNQTVQDVLSDFELVISEKKAHVTVEHLPELEAVGLQMNQLFYNIISNALKFVAKDVTPTIFISTRQLGAPEVKIVIPKAKPAITYYDIAIKDNGIGFDSQFSDQIFEVFKRLHGKDIYPGSGIGLALCRRIVTNHGGLLYSESQPGKGTTFHIILPKHN